jgi:FkbM family methyltransferase
MYSGQLKIDAVLNEKIFKNKKNGFYLECGAFDGVIDSNTLFFNKYLGWSGVNIEPLPNIFLELQKNRKTDLNIKAALSDQTGKKIFTQAIAPDVSHYNGHFGNGSLEHTEQHLSQLNERKCVFEKFEVETYTLPDLFNKFKIDKCIDLFSLDVEGHEIKVLSKLSQLPASLHPKIFVVEYGHCGYANLIKTMEEIEYKETYSDNINVIFQKL